MLTQKKVWSFLTPDWKCNELAWLQSNVSHISLISYLKYRKGISSLSSNLKAFLKILEISFATALLSQAVFKLTLPIRPNSANWALRPPRGMANISPSSYGMHTTSLVTIFDFPCTVLVEEPRLRFGAWKYCREFSTFPSQLGLKEWKKEDGSWMLAGDCSSSYK